MKRLLFSLSLAHAHTHAHARLQSGHITTHGRSKQKHDIRLKAFKGNYCFWFVVQPDLAARSAALKLKNKHLIK